VALRAAAAQAASACSPGSQGGRPRTRAGPQVGRRTGRDASQAQRPTAELVQAAVDFTPHDLVHELDTGDLAAYAPGSIRFNRRRKSGRVSLCFANVVTLTPPRNPAAMSSGHRTAGSCSSAPAARTAAVPSAVLRGRSGLRPRSPSATRAILGRRLISRRRRRPPQDGTLISTLGVRPQECCFARNRAVAGHDGFAAASRLYERRLVVKCGRGGGG
jgi:hypothetical protein